MLEFSKQNKKNLLKNIPFHKCVSSKQENSMMCEQIDFHDWKLRGDFIWAIFFKRKRDDAVLASKIHDELQSENKCLFLPLYKIFVLEIEEYLNTHLCIRQNACLSYFYPRRK